MKPIPLWRLDELPPKEVEDLLDHAEDRLTEARKPGILWGRRIDCLNIATNIAQLFGSDELKLRCRWALSELKGQAAA